MLILLTLVVALALVYLLPKAMTYLASDPRR